MLQRGERAGQGHAAAGKDTIFGVRQFISRMSQHLTLYPGGVLWMGTDGAPENMKDGDVIEVEIPGIGLAVSRSSARSRRDLAAARGRVEG